MNTFDKLFRDFIKNNEDKIGHEICNIIDNGKMCPASEGVSCEECVKYAMKIILKV